jgi:hypothetical protein
MTPKNVLALKNGVYRIYWKSGGSSVASVGRTAIGSVWMAPSDWLGNYILDFRFRIG